MGQGKIVEEERQKRFSPKEIPENDFYEKN